jgi:steroid 5-alpha reductase family enzyme
VLRFPRMDGRTFSAVWPACVGGLAVLYASTGDGAWARRSAIGWMMGAWGARLAVQALYTRASGAPDLSSLQLGSSLQLRTSYFVLLILSLFFSLPALIASRNGEPSLSPIEIAAGVLWVIAFTGETTADRQHLRFASTAGHAGLPCRAGLWRFIPRAHTVFELLLWTSFALFASASPWGGLAFACPAAMLLHAFALTPRS